MAEKISSEKNIFIISYYDYITDLLCVTILKSFLKESLIKKLVKYIVISDKERV